MPVKKLTSIKVPAKIGGKATELTLETSDGKTVEVIIPNDIIALASESRALTIETADLREAINGLTNYGDLFSGMLKSILSGGEDDATTKRSTGSVFGQSGTSLGSIFGGTDGHIGRRY